MKFNRQSAIMQIISQNDIKTQEELSAKLNEMGFNTTQATISRDIKELRLIKVSSLSGGYKYSAPAQGDDAEFLPRLRTIFRECVINIQQAQNLVVINTINGMANAAAFAIDQLKIDNIVGTLAGDDTFLVILPDNEKAAQFCEVAGKMIR
ncbi:MAG: arginine repressor [Ruminococcaceae bacterium]|jgi:transcriptional regulator of arginine metabolism|nr:arginine repressor [Oscillospiraceae bacterium]